MLRDTPSNLAAKCRRASVVCGRARGRRSGHRKTGETQVSLVNQGLIHSRGLRQLESWTARRRAGRQGGEDLGRPRGREGG